MATNTTSVLQQALILNELMEINRLLQSIQVVLEDLEQNLTSTTTVISSEEEALQHQQQEPRQRRTVAQSLIELVTELQEWKDLA